MWDHGTEDSPHAAAPQYWGHPHSSQVESGGIQWLMGRGRVGTSLVRSLPPPTRPHSGNWREGHKSGPTLAHRG